MRYTGAWVTSRAAVPVNDERIQQERRPANTCGALHHFKAFFILGSATSDDIWVPRRSTCIYILRVEFDRGDENQG